MFHFIDKFIATCHYGDYRVCKLIAEALFKVIEAKKSINSVEYTVQLMPYYDELLRCHTTIVEPMRERKSYCSMSATITLRKDDKLRIVNEASISECISGILAIDTKQTFWGLIYLGP